MVTPFPPYNKNRAVGVVDDAARDAAHHGSSHRAAAPAAYDDDPSPQLFTKVNDGPAWRNAHLEVSFLDGTSRLLDLPDLFVEHLSRLAPLRLYHLFKAGRIIG